MHPCMTILFCTPCRLSGVEVAASSMCQQVVEGEPAGEPGVQLSTPADAVPGAEPNPGCGSPSSVNSSEFWGDSFTSSESGQWPKPNGASGARGAAREIWCSPGEGEEGTKPPDWVPTTAMNDALYGNGACWRRCTSGMPGGCKILQSPRVGVGSARVSVTRG